ncbi:MAG: universal stress protein [Chloroflexota bacterium]
MTQTIVVPLDGSELGETALPWAALLARSRGLSLTLVRVVPWPDIPTGEFGGYLSPEVYDEVLAAERSSAREYLERHQAELSTDDLPVQIVIREGMAAEGIHDVADELGAYAVAMASHGRGGVVRVVLGSVAERLLQQATIPVLLVRAGEPTRPASFQRVLVPLDGSALAERGVDQARELVGPEATIILLRVVEPVYDVIGTDDTALVVNDEATAQAEADAKTYLDAQAALLSAQGLKVESALGKGRSATEILQAVEKADANAVVMTTHGHTGPTRWLMGSVADEVFRHADRPVILVSARTLTARVAGPYTVRDLMTRDVEVVEEDESVISVLRKLLRRRVSGAPVVKKNGELVGVVSEHDLLEWHTRVIDELSRDDASLDPAKYAHRIEHDTVGRVVTRPAIAIDEGADLNAATRMLIDRRLRRIAVTNGGRLVGIISRADVLKGMAARWQKLSEDA